MLKIEKIRILLKKSFYLAPPEKPDKGCIIRSYN